MAQKKLQRFAELKTFPNVLQFPENISGKWNSFFKNENPIILELACGKGEYAVGLGEMFPHENFIGIDLKGNRIWIGAKKALQKNLTNVAFLRTQIDRIAEYFSKDEVAEIWITFPDPFLRTSKAKKRLTHPKFLRLYQQFLIPGGHIHLKTDSPVLYDFTKKVIEMYGCKLISNYEDLYQQKNISEELQIKTHYESLDIAQSNQIHYVKFSLPEKLPGIEKDVLLKNILQQDEHLTPSPSPHGEGSNSSVKKIFDEKNEFYFNNEGLVVLTAEYLLQRGYCCGNGCLNCPYDYKAVPEPGRTMLLKKRNELRKDPFGETK